jgi:hypothetical protein
MKRLPSVIIASSASPEWLLRASEKSARYLSPLSEVDDKNCAYELCERNGSAGFQSFRDFASSRSLFSWLTAVAINPPADFAGVASTLPDTPSEFLAPSRPSGRARSKGSRRV